MSANPVNRFLGSVTGRLTLTYVALSALLLFSLSLFLYGALVLIGDRQIDGYLEEVADEFEHAIHAYGVEFISDFLAEEDPSFAFAVMFELDEDEDGTLTEGDLDLLFEYLEEEQAEEHMA